MKTTIEATSVGATYLPINVAAIGDFGIRFGACLKLESGDASSEGLFLGWLNPHGLGRCYGLDVLAQLGGRKPSFFGSFFQLDDAAKEFGLGLEPVNGCPPPNPGPVRLALGEPFLQLPDTKAKKERGGLKGNVLAACETTITLGLGWPDLKKIGAKFTTETVLIRFGSDERRLYLFSGSTKAKIETVRKKTTPSPSPALVGQAIRDFDHREKQFFLLTPLSGDRTGVAVKAGDPFLVSA